LILRVLRSTISPTRYAGAGDRLAFANRSCAAWAESIFVRSRYVKLSSIIATPFSGRKFK
jgi:hypothetical protein